MDKYVCYNLWFTFYKLLKTKTFLLTNYNIKMVCVTNAEIIIIISPRNNNK